MRDKTKVVRLTAAELATVLTVFQYPIDRIEDFKGAAAAPGPIQRLAYDLALADLVRVKSKFEVLL